MVFLTSTGFRNPKVFQLIKQNRKKSINTACIIITGILPEKEKHPLAQKEKKYLLDQSIDEVDFLDVEQQEPSDLPNYDLILIMGGNSSHLFYHLRRSHADEYILRHIQAGKDIVGASAGAWFLSYGRHYSDDYSFLGIDETYPEIVDPNGLNVIAGHLFPHYDMFCNRVPNMESKLRAVEKKRHVEIIRLGNRDFIYKDHEGQIHTVIDQ